MLLGVDASNIRGGGTVNHLAQLLRAAEPAEHGFSKVVVWSGPSTLNCIEDRPWLVKSYQPLLTKSLPFRIFWQLFRLPKLARIAGCDVLFVPGGYFFGDFRPTVTMSQNLAPFQWREIRRYGCSLNSVRLMLLRWAHSDAFRRAAGILFSSHYARKEVLQVVKNAAGRTKVIYHGVCDRFVNRPRESKPIEQYSMDNPCRILYVSTIDMYKHQWHVAEAIKELRNIGWPLVLELVGPAYRPALARLRETLARIDPRGEFCRYSGALPQAEVQARYREADLFVYASSCETFGQILTEAMSCGLPIACSERSAMPEILGDAGLYFDPECPHSIADAVRTFLSSAKLRTKFAQAAFDRACDFTWQRCASETFSFLAEIACTKQS